MTREILVEAFLEGASLRTIGLLLGEDAADVEHGLRVGLREIRDKAEAVSLAPQPGQGEQCQPIERAADAECRDGLPPAPPASHAAALERSAARRRVAADTADLEEYPEAIRGAGMTSMRAAYDALRSGPKRVSGVAEATGLSSACTFSALSGLRQKALAIKHDGWGGEWQLTEKSEE